MLRAALIIVLSLVVSINSHGGSGGPSGSRKMSTVVEFDNLALKLNDSKWAIGRQWYLESGRSSLNVLEAWSDCLRGSRNVTVAVLGDGLNYTAVDLEANYNVYASFNAVDGTDDPMPVSDKHVVGTRTAGIIAAAANTECGVGVAFNTSIAGLRYDFQNVDGRDASLAAALKKRLGQVDVFVSAIAAASADDGLASLGELTAEAFARASSQGRNGKGSIIFWPVALSDVEPSCAYDGYVNDVVTVVVAPVNKTGRALAGAQTCGAVLACAFSKEEHSDDAMVTIGGGGVCEEDFHGSVPAAAFGAGIAALALQANPELGWRDMQHLIVETSNADIMGSEFKTNAAGRKVSVEYGFGLLDAGKLTSLARTWAPVTELQICQLEVKLGVGAWNKDYVVNLPAACLGRSVKYTEHVQLAFSTNNVDLSDLVIDVTSPSGTKARLVPGRRSETTLAALSWQVMSVAFWGEEGHGDWTVGCSSKSDLATGALTAMVLTVRGTESRPGQMQSVVVNPGYHVVGGNTTNDAHKHHACPVLGPFETQRPKATDFKPLYIFIAIIGVVFSIMTALFIFKQCKKNVSCHACGPAFKQVPQTV